MHESLDEFRFRPDTTTNSRVICLCESEKLMYNVVNTSAYIDLPFFILSGNEDNLKVWTEVEFEADRTKGCGVSCP